MQMPGLRIIHTCGLIHDRRHILQLTLLEKQCKAKQPIRTGSGPRQPIQSALNIPALQTVSDGTRPRHKPSQRDNQRWESHVNKSFCSLTLQSEPCLQPIFLPVNTLPCTALLHPRHAQKGETGSCRSKTDGGGEAPKERIFVLSVYPHQGWIYVPRRRANETSRLPPRASHNRRDVDELLKIPQDFWFDPMWMQGLHLSHFTIVSFK